ncbi:putative bifunctional diguanylate cyclase/phosphodiesterase [Jidongwangia harbinensis]|uniref:putative bifunctional diguanylate cyclase/phosphodiesterase n=1 Tax=Jidongwangia harbinensis TaxID=2878561 RepID=UPI001CD98729|nr:EAL domain-containing protein [Jidongwangia harbinensis]MCA2214795.1 EAL domain-containing protein [Jidongwangia harbinensis]
MTTGRQLTVRLPVTLALVAAVIAVGETAVPAGSAQRLYIDTAQFLAGAAAAAICLATAHRHGTVGRLWRRCLGAGLTGWAVQRLWWVVQDVLDPDRSTTATNADVGFLVLPFGVLLALLAGAAAAPRPVPTSSRRDLVVLVIDSVMIAASLVALVWSTVPGRLFQQAGDSPYTVGVAAAYPLADLVLVTMAVLLLITRPTVPGVRTVLQLIIAALLAFGVSDTVRLLQVPGEAMTPVQSAGFVLGAALMGLAALHPPLPAGEPVNRGADAEWMHLLLPYVPVIATGVVIAVRTGTGRPLNSYEAYLGWLGLGLVVARQMFTIVDNTVLLARVSEGQQRLRHQAYHDPLTGLANRALFHERLVGALEAQRRDGRPVALLFADLDDFKLINDSFGHAIGDRLLRAIGERLVGCVPPDDLVARLGGDEFAVLLEHHPAEAEPTGHRMLAALRHPFVIDGHTVGVGASIGLVVPEPSDRTLDADTLLRRADAAMYASKRHGKGTLARYAGGADGGPHVDLPHLLAQALAGSPAAAGFEVYYQPIVRFSDGATVAVEALARWTDPVVGPVDPDVFVTVAERTGLVAAIDDFVLDRACADAATLANTYGRPIDVHVNVSAARLGQDGLEDAVLRAVERHAVHPSRLVVEITETRRIPDLPRAATVAARLRAYGVRIALDDFGSGYNALAQLHSLPVDIVKLDSTLTDVDIAPERAGVLLRSVVGICADLNVAVVAEGIETPGRGRALAKLGCHFGQGYLFGQPVPVHQLVGTKRGEVPWAPAPRSHTEGAHT